MLDKQIPDCTIYPLDTATPVSVIGKIIECIKSYRGWTMGIEHIANLAAIIGAASILATLGFVVLEIRVNLAQFSSVKEISLHDVQTQFFLYWSKRENAELIIKARKNFDQLEEAEKFAFENYVELRIRYFLFGFKFIRNRSSRPFQISRIKHFFSFSGTYKCYQNMVQEKRIPTLWSQVIDASMDDKNPDLIFKIATKGV